MKSELQLIGIEDPNVYLRVRAAAERDQHANLEPDCYYLRDGEIVGALNLGRLACCHAWLKRGLGARGTVQAFRLMEEACRERGAEGVVIPVANSSVMFAKLPHFEYVPWIEGMVWAKAFPAHCPPPKAHRPEPKA